MSKNKALVSRGFIFLIITNLLDVLPPMLIGIAIDQIFIKDAGLTKISMTLLALGTVGVLTAYGRYLWRINWGQFHHGVAKDLQDSIFAKFMKLTQAYFDKTPVGQSMSLITQDVQTFRMAMGPGVLILLDALLLIVFIPPLMFSISIDWTWKTLILMPLIPFVISKILKLIFKSVKQRQDEFAGMSGVVQEIVAGVRVIKSFAKEDLQTRLFNKDSRRFEIACNKVAKIDSFFAPVLEVSVTFGAIILLLVGAPEVISEEVTIGAFFAFYQYIQKMVWPMTAIGLSFTHIQSGRAAFKRIQDLLESEEDIDLSDQEDLEKFEHLEVKNLWFKYPESDEWVLKDISFKFSAGDKLGLVGLTGSGKSTLLAILAGIYPYQKGEIYINGKAFSHWTKSSLRNCFVVVPQEAFLFSQTIHQNLVLDREILKNQLEESLSHVSLDKELETIPHGLNAELGERGVNLSGGQKQRVTIARGLLREGTVTLFDDSLSAVDGTTEKAILNALTSDESKSFLMVSHRLKSFASADKILVFNQGELEAEGRHEELMETSETYQDLAKLQGGQNV